MRYCAPWIIQCTCFMLKKSHSKKKRVAMSSTIFVQHPVNCFHWFEQLIVWKIYTKIVARWSLHKNRTCGKQFKCKLEFLSNIFVSILLCYSMSMLLHSARNRPVNRRRFGDKMGRWCNVNWSQIMQINIYTKPLIRPDDTCITHM